MHHIENDLNEMSVTRLQHRKSWLDCISSNVIRTVTAKFNRIEFSSIGNIIAMDFMWLYIVHVVVVGADIGEFSS